MAAGNTVKNSNAACMVFRKMSRPRGLRCKQSGRNSRRFLGLISEKSIELPP